MINEMDYLWFMILVFIKSTGCPTTVAKNPAKKLLVK